MPPYRQIGSVPRKRHTAHRQEPGYRGEGIYYEEVVTTAGFGRAYSIAYHLRPPTRVRKVEPAGTVALDVVPQPALRHFHVKSGKMPRGGDPVRGRVALLANQDVILSRCRPDRPQDTRVLVKDGTRLTRYTMAHHPFDVVGWDGMVYPHTFNAEDFEPITGTVHQPPPIHQTFQTDGFVVCTFAPRMLDTHPQA